MNENKLKNRHSALALRLKIEKWVESWLQNNSGPCFNLQNSHLSTLFLPTEEVFQVIYNTHPDSIRAKLFAWVQNTLSIFVLIKVIIFVP